MRPGPFGEAVSRHLPFPLPACPLRPKTWACFCMITMSLPAERAAEVEVVGGKDQAAPLRLGKPLRARTRAGNHAALCSPCSLCCRCRPPKATPPSPLQQEISPLLPYRPVLLLLLCPGTRPGHTEDIQEDMPGTYRKTLGGSGLRCQAQTKLRSTRREETETGTCRQAPMNCSPAQRGPIPESPGRRGEVALDRPLATWPWEVRTCL